MLPKIDTDKKIGNEAFLFNDKHLDMNVLSFWQWSSSDLLTNRQRGILAEYIIATALELDTNLREECDAYDLVTKNGIKIEIKSASYIQSWEQEKYSNKSFGIQPTIRWEENKRTSQKVRQSDIYIFCLLAHKDYKTINPLDLNQWDFYLVETKTLNEKMPYQKTITLNSLLKLNPKRLTYMDIKKEINSI